MNDQWDPPHPKVPPAAQDSSNAIIADLAMETFRVERIVTSLHSQELSDCTQLRSLMQDHLQRIKEIYAAHGVELRDHTGDLWIDGLSLNVVHAREGVCDAVVVETIRPSVVLGGRVIAHGYVVVGDRSELEQDK